MSDFFGYTPQEQLPQGIGTPYDRMIRGFKRGGLGLAGGKGQARRERFRMKIGQVKERDEKQARIAKFKFILSKLDFSNDDEFIKSFDKLSLQKTKDLIIKKKKKNPIQDVKDFNDKVNSVANIDNITYQSFQGKSQEFRDGLKKLVPYSLMKDFQPTKGTTKAKGIDKIATFLRKFSINETSIKKYIKDIDTQKRGDIIIKDIEAKIAKDIIPKEQEIGSKTTAKDIKEGSKVFKESELEKEKLRLGQQAQQRKRFEGDIKRIEEKELPPLITQRKETARQYGTLYQQKTRRQAEEEAEANRVAGVRATNIQRSNALRDKGTEIRNIQSEINSRNTRKDQLENYLQNLPNEIANLQSTYNYYSNELGKIRRTSARERNAEQRRNLPIFERELGIAFRMKKQKEQELANLPNEIEALRRGTIQLVNQIKGERATERQLARPDYSAERPRPIQTPSVNEADFQRLENEFNRLNTKVQRKEKNLADKRKDLENVKDDPQKKDQLENEIKNIEEEIKNFENRIESLNTEIVDIKGRLDIEKQRQETDFPLGFSVEEQLYNSIDRYANKANLVGVGFDNINTPDDLQLQTYKNEPDRNPNQPSLFFKPGRTGMVQMGSGIKDALLGISPIKQGYTSFGKLEDGDPVLLNIGSETVNYDPNKIGAGGMGGLSVSNVATPYGNYQKAQLLDVVDVLPVGQQQFLAGHKAGMGIDTNQIDLPNQVQELRVKTLADPYLTATETVGGVERLRQIPEIKEGQKVVGGQTVPIPYQRKTIEKSVSASGAYDIRPSLGQMEEGLSYQPATFIQGKKPQTKFGLKPVGFQYGEGAIFEDPSTGYRSYAKEAVVSYSGALIPQEKIRGMNPIQPTLQQKISIKEKTY